VFEAMVSLILPQYPLLGNTNQYGTRPHHWEEAGRSWVIPIPSNFRQASKAAKIDVEVQRQRLKTLINLGKERGFLTTKLMIISRMPYD
jgi:hypothetical protein